MAKENSPAGIVSLLLSFGLTWRATTLLFVFITLFNVFSVVFVYFSDKESLMVWASALIPLVAINVILGIAVLNPTLKKHLLAGEKSSLEQKPQKNYWQKSLFEFCLLWYFCCFDNYFICGSNSFKPY